MDKPYIYFSEEMKDLILEWHKEGARFSLFFGYEGSKKTKEDFGWVYVDKNGEMRGGELPDEIFDAIMLFINYKKE